MAAGFEYGRGHLKGKGTVSPFSARQLLLLLGRKEGRKMSLPVAILVEKQSAMFHSWCTRKEQTSLCRALSLGLENPLKMLREFNISQQKVLLEKGKGEWGKLFPVSFLVSTNQACSSGECFSFFFFFLLQFLFAKPVVQWYARPSFLQDQAANCLTWDSCLFLVFFTVIILENAKKQKEEN